MQAITIINQIRKELNDEDEVTWDDGDMLSYINSAQNQVVLVRPDANSVRKSITLTAGETQHSLETGDLRLLGVTRNMGADGLTPGRPITMIAQEDQDLFDRDWHTKTGKTSIREVLYNEKVPQKFFTNPAAHATTAVQIEVDVSQMPTQLTDIDVDAISLDDIYEQPIRQYMLHLAYALEVESMTSSRKSRAYLQDFYNSLGLKTKVDAMYSPSKEVNPNG